MDDKEVQTLIENVDRLCNERNIKHSELEKDIVSPGYIAKLGNPNNKSKNPSIDKIRKLANRLNVSIDYLLCSKSSHTSDDISLIDFFESVYNKTESDKLYWHMTALEDIYKHEYDFEIYGPVVECIGSLFPEYETYYPSHILKEIDNHIDQRYNLDGEIPWFGSLSLGLGKEINNHLYTEAKIVDDFFYSRIEGIDSTLYLYSMEYSGEDSPPLYVIESYLQNGSKNHYLCNSIQHGNYIASKLNDLFQLAKDTSNADKLEEGTRKLLNKYNAYSKGGDTNDK